MKHSTELSYTDEIITDSAGLPYKVIDTQQINFSEASVGRKKPTLVKRAKGGEITGALDKNPYTAQEGDAIYENNPDDTYVPSDRSGRRQQFNELKSLGLDVTDSREMDGYEVCYIKNNRCFKLLVETVKESSCIKNAWGPDQHQFLPLGTTLKLNDDGSVTGINPLGFMDYWEIIIPSPQETIRVNVEDDLQKIILMTTNLSNFKKALEENPALLAHYFYFGRPKKNRIHPHNPNCGNPFPMDESKGGHDRNEVCHKDAKWWVEENDDYLPQEFKGKVNIKELKPKAALFTIELIETLQANKIKEAGVAFVFTTCHCASLACHCDIALPYLAGELKKKYPHAEIEILTSEQYSPEILQEYIELLESSAPAERYESRRAPIFAADDLFDEEYVSSQVSIFEACIVARYETFLKKSNSLVSGLRYSLHGSSGSDSTPTNSSIKMSSY